MKVLFDKKNLGLAAYLIKYLGYYYASSKNKLVFIMYYMQFLNIDLTQLKKSFVMKN